MQPTQKKKKKKIQPCMGPHPAKWKWNNEIGKKIEMGKNNSHEADLNHIGETK